MTTMTDDEKRALCVEVEERLGRNLGVFDPDGDEVTEWLDDALYSMPLEMRPFQGKSHVHTYLMNGNWHSTGYGSMVRRAMWLNRHGETWQVDIEAHVKAHRAEPRPFLDDIGLAFKLAEALRLTVTPGLNGWLAANCNWSQSGSINAVGLTNGRPWHEGATVAEAIVRAALPILSVDDPMKVWGGLAKLKL